MKKIIVYLTAVLVFCSVSMVGCADCSAETGGTSVTINLEDLPSSTVTQILKAKKEADAQSATVTDKVVQAVVSQDPSDLGQLAEDLEAIAKTIGTFVTELCKALSISANEFLSSPAGIGIAGIIIWKVGGPYVVDQIVDIFFGTLAWFILTTIWIWIYHRMFFKQIWKKEAMAKEGTDKPTTIKVSQGPLVVWKKTDDRSMGMIIACIVYLFICLVCAGTVAW